MQLNYNAKAYQHIFLTFNLEEKIVKKHIHKTFLFVFKKNDTNMHMKYMSQVSSGFRKDPYLQEAKHDRQDILGVRSKVFICGNAVDDFEHQLP